MPALQVGLAGPVPRAARPQARGRSPSPLDRRRERDFDGRLGGAGGRRPRADRSLGGLGGGDRDRVRRGDRRGHDRRPAARERRCPAACPWTCRSRHCRLTWPSWARRAAARPGWPRSSPRRRSARVSRSWRSTRRGTSSSSSARPPSRTASTVAERCDAPRVPRPGRAAHLDARLVARPATLPRPDPPARRATSWRGSPTRTGARRSGKGCSASPRPSSSGLAKVGGETDSQQTFLLQVFRRLASGGHGRDVTLEAIAAAASDPRSIGLDDPDQLIKKAERTKLARKLHAMRLGPASALFTGGTRLDLDALCRPDAGRQDAAERLLLERTR